MGRSPSFIDQKAGLKKGPWTPAEDQKLMACIQDYGPGRWRALPAKAGLQRCGKSCRLRWTNYLRPDIKRGKFSLQEEQTIIQLHALLGNRWSAMATHLPKRTDNEIKNYWNTHLKKRLTKMGIDPVTHKPIHYHAFVPGSVHAKDAAILSHMTQWENARLEAETRLVKETNHLVNITTNNSSSPKLVNITPSDRFRKTSATSALYYLDVLKAWQGAKSLNPTIRDNSCSNISSGMNMMKMATDELESPSSILDISENVYNARYPMQPIDAKELPQFIKELGNANVVFQEAHAYNNYQDVWFPEDGRIRSLGRNSDAINVIPPAAAPAINSKITEGFGSTDDMFVYTSDENNMADGIISDYGGGVNAGRDSSGNIIEDQNMSYWNNILNLVNVSPNWSHI